MLPRCSIYGARAFQSGSTGLAASFGMGSVSWISLTVSVENVLREEGAVHIRPLTSVMPQGGQ